MAVFDFLEGWYNLHRRHSLVEAFFDGIQESVWRGLGQQPEIAGERPPPSIIGFSQHLADDRVHPPVRVWHGAYAAAPQRQQDNHLTDTVAQHAGIVAVDTLDRGHPALARIHIEARVGRSQHGVRGCLEPGDIGAGQVASAR
jgi:hypothetical protein